VNEPFLRAIAADAEAVAALAQAPVDADAARPWHLPAAARARVLDFREGAWTIALSLALVRHSAMKGNH